MSGALTLNGSMQAQLAIKRLTTQLADLQRQVASDKKANDLQGYGASAGRLLSAQSLKANADAHASVLNQLDARFGVQGAALGQAADAVTSLAQSIRQAISANDGRGISTDLPMAFASIVGALNESWNGQPLFAGERQNGPPVKITTLDELAASTGPDDIFDEAARHQTIDLGTGTPITLASKASEMSSSLFDTMRSLYALVQASGGTIGNPLSEAQQTQLTAIAGQLDAQASNFNTFEGRSGQLQTQFENQGIRLSNRSDLLQK